MLHAGGCLAVFGLLLGEEKRKAKAQDSALGSKRHLGEMKAIFAKPVAQLAKMSAPAAGRWRVA